MKMMAGLMAIIAIVAVVVFAGCTEKEAPVEIAPSSSLTQIRIMDVDVITVGLSQFKVDMTIKNIGDATAKNVIASVIIVTDEHTDDVLNRPSLLRKFTEDEKGGLCLDREYLGDIEPDQYAKATLLINSDDLLEGFTAIKAATADNAEAVCY